MARTGRPPAWFAMRDWATGATAVCLAGRWSGDPALVARLERAEWWAPAHGLPLSPVGPWVLPDDVRWAGAVAIAATGGRCALAGRGADGGFAPLRPGEVS